MIVAYSVISRVLEKHIANHALNSREGESTVNELLSKVTSGFPLYGLPLWLVIVMVIALVLFFAAYTLVGKGQGSHAGREEVRRSYRRELAKQMARQDAEKIKAGEKVRRKWMQW